MPLNPALEKEFVDLIGNLLDSTDDKAKRLGGYLSEHSKAIYALYENNNVEFKEILRDPMQLEALIANRVLVNGYSSASPAFIQECYAHGANIRLAPADPDKASAIDKGRAEYSAYSNVMRNGTGYQQMKSDLNARLDGIVIMPERTAPVVPVQRRAPQPHRVAAHGIPQRGAPRPHMGQAAQGIPQVGIPQPQMDQAVALASVIKSIAAERAEGKHLRIPNDALQVLQANPEILKIKVDGKTPLQLAASLGERTAVDDLIAAGHVDAQTQHRLKAEAFRWAVGGGKVSPDQLRQQWGDCLTDPEILKQRGRNGFTPLQLAARTGNAAVVGVFTASAPPDKWKQLAGEALRHAIAGGMGGDELKSGGWLARPEILNQRGRNGLTPLQLAAKMGKVDVVNALIATELDPKKQNQLRSEALRYAIAGRKVTADQLQGEEWKDFMTPGILEQKGKSRKTALQLAREMGRDKVAGVLKAAYAKAQHAAQAAEALAAFPPKGRALVLPNIESTKGPQRPLPAPRRTPGRGSNSPAGGIGGP